MKKDIKSLLQSSDPAQRREAIITLGKTRDSRAMPLLAKIYHSDPDPALRELARQAGQYIQTHTAEQAPSPSEAPPPSPAEHVPAFSDPTDDYGFSDDLESPAGAGYGYETVSSDESNRKKYYG